MKSTFRYFAIAALALTTLISAPAAQAQVLVTSWGGPLINYNPGTNSSNPLPAPVAQPQGMVIGPDGYLYMSNLNTNTVDKYDPVSGASLGVVIDSATLGTSFQPSGLAFYNGDLYVSKQAGYPGATPGSGGVFKFSGGVLTPIVENITQAEGLAVFGDNLFIAELNNYTNGGRILKYNFTTSNLSTFVDQTVITPPVFPDLPHAPAGLTMGPDGMLYVADVAGFEIHRYDPNNAAIHSSAVGTFDPGLSSPTGIAFVGTDMYVSNIGTGMAFDGFLSKYTLNSGNYVFAGKVVDNLLYGSAVVAVPEPSSLLLLGVPAAGWWMRRRKAKA